MSEWVGGGSESAARGGWSEAAPSILFLIIVAMVGKLLALGRETLIAAFFGASDQTDAYVLAVGLPTMLFAAVGVALGASFIPTFTRREQEGGAEAAFRSTNSLINLLLVSLLAVVLLCELFATQIVQVVAPGFPQTTLQLAVRLSRWTLPTILFATFAGVLTGLLQARLNFVIPAVAGLASSLALVASVILAGAWKNIEVAAAGGLLAGAVLVVIQAVRTPVTGYRYQWGMDLRDPGLRQMAKLGSTVLVSTAIGQVSLIVARVLASYLEVGSIAALNYAMQIQILPIHIVAMAISTVMFPLLSQEAAKNEGGAFARLFTQASRWTLLSLLPVTIILVVLGETIVKLVYGRGVFDIRAVQMTTVALVFYAPGVVSIAMRDLLNRSIFALRKTRIVLLGALLEVSIAVGLSVILVGPLKHGGLALASSLAPLGSSLLCFWFLRTEVATSISHGLVALAVKSGLAACGAILAVKLATQLLNPLFTLNESIVVRFADGALVFSFGVGIFFLISLLLNVEEVSTLARKMADYLFPSVE